MRKKRSVQKLEQKYLNSKRTLKFKFNKCVKIQIQKVR